jgi:hypothetical protein
MIFCGSSSQMIAQLYIERDNIFHLDENNSLPTPAIYNIFIRNRALRQEKCNRKIHNET